MENRTEKLSALKDFLRKSSKAYEKVDAVIGFILEDKGKTSVNSTFSTKEIIEAYNELKKRISRFSRRGYCRNSYQYNCRVVV